MRTISTGPEHSNFTGQFFQNALAIKLREIKIALGLTKYLKRIKHYFSGKAMIFLDTDGTVLNWNETCQRLQGYSEKEIVGQKLGIFYPNHDRQNHLPEQQMILAEINGSVTIRGKWLKKDGTTFIGSMIIKAVRSVYTNKLIGFTEEIFPLFDDEEN